MEKNKALVSTGHVFLVSNNTWFLGSCKKYENCETVEYCLKMNFVWEHSQEGTKPHEHLKIQGSVGLPWYLRCISLIKNEKFLKNVQTKVRIKSCMIKFQCTYMYVYLCACFFALFVPHPEKNDINTIKGPGKYSKLQVDNNSTFCL